MIAVTCACAAALAPSPWADAAWSPSGTGAGAAAAATMPAGSTPAASATGSSVTVTWTADDLSSGAAVTGYVISRDNALNGAPATVGASCAGVVASTSCTETSVPSGSWVYLVTPVVQNWTGATSAAGNTVTVP